MTAPSRIDGLTDGLTVSVIAAMGKVARDIILPRYNRLSKSDVRTKTSAADLVTIADEESEKALSAALTILRPEAKVVGEEGIAADPDALEKLLRQDPLWIIDPIDGTANFVGGKPAFAVVVALVSEGATVMGWIHDPLSGQTLWAERGKGVWLRTADSVTDTRLRLAPAPTALDQMTAAFYSREFAGVKGKFARVMRQGSAAHDYWALADGRLQVVGYRRLKPWDHAAGLLIHTEAGGYNAMLSGEAYNPIGLEQVGLLCAPDAESWRVIKGLIEA